LCTSGCLLVQVIDLHFAVGPVASVDTRQTVMELLERIALSDPEKIAELYAERVAWKLDWPPAHHSRTVPWIRERSTRPVSPWSSRAASTKARRLITSRSWRRQSRRAAERR
jgi:hypothetical protein